MEPPFTSTALQSSAVDTIMGENEAAYETNGHLVNGGYLDPRELQSHPYTNQENSPNQPHREAKSESSKSQEEEIEDTVPFLERSYLPTGCCYDDRMKYHANADYSDNVHHPEDPRRIEAIMNAFREAGLIYGGSDEELGIILREAPTKYMWRITAREATREEICLAHTSSHYEWVEDLATKTTSELRAMTMTFDEGRKSLYVSSLTNYAAKIAAGGAIESCKSVVKGEVKNAIAIIRPPGHHAENNESMGFCIFNNVPVAAKVCMKDYPETCRKVLILDWDVHHGNGVQNIFYEDPNVLYISIHVYQDGNFYPGKPDMEGIPDGGIPNVGFGPGAGYNINIGWHAQGMGDGEYMAAFQKIVMPVAQEFDPDLVIISAGFDAAAGDELGGCFVSPECYSQMTHMLMSLAGGKVVVCLEGGYSLDAISRSALAVAQTLMGEPAQRLAVPACNAKAGRDLDSVRFVLSPYWKCMRPGIVQVQDLEARKAERLSAVVRAWEKNELCRKHNMAVVPVLRNRLNKVFENQVLVTPKIAYAKKILLIIHDPPQIVAQADSLTNNVLSHNAWMPTDIFPFIDWAVENGFGVIDVNFPKEIPQNDTTPFHQRPTEDDVQQQSKDLLGYLWDNHLAIFPTIPVALLGVGDAYLGIKQLLISREVRHRIPCVLSFVTGSLRPVKSETDPGLSTWYKTNSLIYVSSDHSCWNDEENHKRVKKNRFGRVEQSEVTGIGSMLAKYQKNATAWLGEQVRKWEAERGSDPDETEEEGEFEMGDGLGMSGPSTAATFGPPLSVGDPGMGIPINV
ncbi:hypothetical protein HYALB_00009674 [Hymenoscyphus albidus]|uniref:Histone deacetylase n=1 Tax=Hymenoscyphus albidus TaxID=595503 RepID=A0A9N9L9F8_9HELO|nr:hypothetical protein HYALB_00009674 [Hymenoscyphus albidus]